MRKKQFVIGASVALGVYLGYRLASNVMERVRERLGPFTKRTFLGEEELLYLFEGFWRHPEAVALMRSNPQICAPLTNEIVAVVEEALGVPKPRSSERLFAWGAVTRPPVGEAPSLTAQEREEILAFARHYAETGGIPSDEMLESIRARLGARTCRDLVTFLRLVTMGVLVGNTVDAFFSRLAGHPSPYTTLGQELKILAVFFLGIVPLLPVMYLRTLINPAGSALPVRSETAD